jgi:hypothetical protein
LSTSRASVVPRSSEGNTLNSSGRLTYIVVSRITTEIVMLAESSKSSRPAGSGTTITRIDVPISAGTIRPRFLVQKPRTE